MSGKGCPLSHIATYVPATSRLALVCWMVIGPQTWVDGVGVTASSISNVCVLCELVLTV